MITTRPDVLETYRVIQYAVWSKFVASGVGDNTYATQIFLHFFVYTWIINKPDSIQGNSNVGNLHIVHHILYPTVVDRHGKQTYRIGNGSATNTASITANDLEIVQMMAAFSSIVSPLMLVSQLLFVEDPSRDSAQSKNIRDADGRER